MRPASRTSAQDDAELLRSVAAGDLGALGVLFDRYHDVVRSVALHAGVPRADADDVVQETFLRLSTMAPRYDGRPNARPWIAGTAWRVSAERRRSVGRWLRALASMGRDEPAHERTPEDDNASRQRWERFCGRVSGLPEKLRAAYVLVEVQGLSGEEAAHALEIPVATVWTRLHNARKKLLADGGDL